MESKSHSRQSSSKYNNSVMYKSISFIIFISMLTVVPNTLKIFWPTFLGICAQIGQVDIWMFVIVGMAANLLSMLINNLFMLYVYRSNLPYF